MSLNFERHGHGEPMLLLHGIGGELCVWEPVLERLAASHDVIAVDLPGFGHSPGLSADVTPTPAALARAVASFLDELQVDRVHAVGNSLGGWLALELAVLGRAHTVTGICPAGLWPAPTLRQGAVARSSAHLAVRRLRLLVPLLMASPQIRRLMLRPFVAHPERIPYHAAVRMVRSYGRGTAYAATATAMRQSFFSATSDLTVPVTLAFGERDGLIRPAPGRIPGARTIILRDCGHIPMWDDPELVVTVIEDSAAETERLRAVQNPYEIQQEAR